MNQLEFDMRELGKKIGLLVFSALLVFSFCTENDKPASIYGPETVSPDPVITSLSPEGKAFSGVTEITVTGENFRENPEENFIYFGTVKGEITSASANQLTVVPPVIEQNDLTVKLAVKGAYQFAAFSPYSLEYAARIYGDYGSFDNIMTMAMDKEENLYVHKGNKEIEKMTPDGTRTIIGSASINVTTSMKVGPNGNLYMVRKNNYIYLYDLNKGEDEKFVKVSGRLIDIDFDQNGIIYGAGKGDGITTIQPDGSSFVETTDYADYDISSLRVYNGYVYVFAVYTGSGEAEVESGIWRNPITANDGSLGAKELYFNWGAYAADGASVLDFEIDTEGNFYLGTDKGVGIVKLDVSKNAAPYYERVIFPSSKVMCWGNSNSLYIYRDSSVPEEKKVYQAKTDAVGAPYYGRNL